MYIHMAVLIMPYIGIILQLLFLTTGLFLFRVIEAV